MQLLLLLLLLRGVSVLLRTWKTYSISKGAKFALQRKKQATELTSEMLAR
jgi:hypothetical protein